MNLDALGRRFARVATNVVVARPALWPLLRVPLRLQFERLAGCWEGRRGEDALEPLARALDRLDDVGSALDLGTGTGKGARLVAQRFPAARVVGVDLAPAMVAEARRLLPEPLADRVRFEVADSARLPYGDGEFDLVVLLNMIPFFDELARVTAPGGVVVVASYSGPSTPIWTPPAVLRRRLEPLGFDRFEELAAGTGDALLAWKADRP